MKGIGGIADNDIYIHLDLLQKVVPYTNWCEMQEDRKDKLVCLDCSHSGLKYFAQWLYTGTLPTIIPESQHEWESQFLGLTWAYQVGEWMGCVDFQDTVADTMIPLFFDHPPNDVNLPIDTCSLGFPGTQLLVDLIVYGPASCLKDAQGVHFGYKYWQGCDDEDFMDHLASEIAKAEGQDWPEALESRKLGIMLVCGFVEAKVHHDSGQQESKLWVRSPCRYHAHSELELPCYRSKQ